MIKLVLVKHKFFAAFFTALVMFAFTGVSHAEIREASEDTDKGLFGLPLIPKDSIFKNCYIGAGAGGVNSNYSRSNDDGSLGGNFDKDDSSLSGNVYFGYELTDHFGFETGYYDLGKSTFDSVSTGGTSWSAGPVSADHEAYGGSFAAVVRYPLNDRLSLIGTAGMFWWVSKETFLDGGVTTVEQESGSSATFSGGLEWDVGVKDRFVWRTEVHQFVVDDSSYDLTQYTFSVVYRFP